MKVFLQQLFLARAATIRESIEGLDLSPISVTLAHMQIREYEELARMIGES